MFLAVRVSHTCFWWTWQFYQVLVRTSLWGTFQIPHHHHTKVMGFGEKTRQGKCHHYPAISRAGTVSTAHPCWINTCHLAMAEHVLYPAVKSLCITLLSILCYLQGSQDVQLTLKGVIVPCEWLHKLFGNLLHRRVISSIPPHTLLVHLIVYICVEA